MDRPVAGAAESPGGLRYKGPAGSGTLAGRKEERRAPLLPEDSPPQVGPTLFCTDVLSEGPGSGTRTLKTRHSCQRKEGKQAEAGLRKRGRGMPAELDKPHSGLKDEESGSLHSHPL